VECFDNISGLHVHLRATSTGQRYSVECFDNISGLHVHLRATSTGQRYSARESIVGECAVCTELSEEGQQ
jgi:hypothetical protein